VGFARVGAGQSGFDAQPRALERPGLQARNEGLQEAIGVGAIQDPVIDGECHVAFRAHDDALHTRLLDHCRAPFELADAENGRLRLIDDNGCCEEAAARAVIRERESAAAQGSRREFACTRARNEVVEAPCNAK